MSGDTTTATTTANSTTTSTEKRTPKESDVYDRQIRLWGAESQAKMQNSKVLYIHVTGTSAEVLKNLVLAGISATLCDQRPVETMDSSPHFFSPPPRSSNSDNNNKKLKYDSVAHAVKPLVSLSRLIETCLTSKERKKTHTHIFCCSSCCICLLYLVVW